MLILEIFFLLILELFFLLILEITGLKTLQVSLSVLTSSKLCIGGLISIRSSSSECMSNMRGLNGSSSSERVWSCAGSLNLLFLQGDTVAKPNPLLGVSMSWLVALNGPV
uniref:Uncharacterized protein n=1 Tax=Cacopsylla melanoneura TaxID=428564 RepID=A0A8D8YLT4_9HEMI